MELSENMFTADERVIVNRYLSEPEQLQNPRIALYNMMVDVRNLAEFSKEALNDEVVDYAIAHDFVLPSSYNSDIFSNYKLATYLVKQNPQNLLHVDRNILTEELITMALDDGLEFDPSHYSLMHNEKFLKVVISRNANLLNYVEKDYVTDELVELAKNKKFIFQFLGNRTVKRPYYEDFSDDIDGPNNNLYLLNYDELVISSFINGYEAIIYEENIPHKNKYYNYMLEKALSDKIPIDNLRNFSLYENETFNNYINNNLFVSDNARKLMSQYLKDEYIKQNLELSSYILCDEFVETFGLLVVDMIIKYLICPKAEFKIDKLLQVISIKDFKTIFDLLYNENGQLKVLQIQKMVNYFASNIKLLKQIVDSDINGINSDYLRILVNEGNHDIQINGIEQLNNLNGIRYEFYDKSNLVVRDKIFAYLTGKGYFAFNEIQQEEINSLRYKQLLKKNGNDNLEDQKLVSYLEYLEKLSQLSTEQLDKIWLELQNNHPKIYLLDDIIRAFKNNFFDLYKNNLTELKGKKESYVEDDIPVFEYNGENFSFIAHSFNAFDSRYITANGISSMYEHTIGRSYVATSYINQNHYSISVMNGSCINFIFGDFSNENLISSSYKDIYINGEENNSLDVSVNSSKYLDPFEMACLTQSYNEMDFYRISNNDYKSIPSAVLCYDEITENDKRIANNYQLPIVIIKTEAYKNLNHELWEKYKAELIRGDNVHLKEFLGLSRKLHININVEELVAMFEGVSVDKIEELLLSLRIFGYDENVIDDIRAKYVVSDIDVKQL